ncbi:ABC transporter substrate-binding protein [Jatrophihabitans sp.]|uniref:ABC transporter substrate-binding protein n=1 Tax=Jatrophihabitans sp. TaxID=1932789 RepID=UPI0030C7159B|nr:transporter substrate-binding protein [Jatrophihabitans sp.]
MTEEEKIAVAHREISRRSLLRGGLGLGAIAIAGPLLAACSSSGGSGSSKSSSTTPTSSSPAGSSSAAGTVAPGTYGDIAVQLSWIKNIEFAGEFFADSKGYYTAAGFKSVNLVANVGGATDIDQSVALGKTLVGLSAPDSTARHITDNGSKLKIIASTYQKNPFCILSIAEHKPIRTPADLKGKRIAIQPGPNQGIFAGFLKANGLKASDMTIVSAGFTPDELIAGKQDGYMAYLTNEPFLVSAAKLTPVTLGFADNGLPLTAETYCVLQDTIDKKRDLLKAFLVAEIKGWTDAIASPSESATLAVTNYGKDQKLSIPEQTQEATAQNDLIVSADTKTNGILTLTDALQANIVKAIAAEGITITGDELFDMSLINEVYKEHPELIG